MENKKINKKVDRIIIDPANLQIINDITRQVQKELGDAIKINSKIVCNFLIKLRVGLLTSDELDLLKRDNQDVVHALKKITQNAIHARKNGSEISFDELSKILQTLGVNNKLPILNPRGRKKSKKDSNLQFSTKATQPMSNSEELK